jgi:hypothetical protein
MIPYLPSTLLTKSTNDQCLRHLCGVPPTFSADGAALSSVLGWLQAVTDSVMVSKGLRHRIQVGTMKWHYALSGTDPLACQGWDEIENDLLEPFSARRPNQN